MTSTTINRQPKGIDLYNRSPLRTLLSALPRLPRLTRVAPAAAAQRDLARDVAAVRALAHTYRKTDRGFAADLYAAADRHERTVEGAAGPFDRAV
jgi:hypothetical protein